MELQQTRTQKRLQQHVDAADKVKNATNSSAMKQVIFWILMLLALVCVVSLGMILINYTMNARV